MCGEDAEGGFWIWDRKILTVLGKDFSTIPKNCARGDRASTPYGMIYLVYEYAIRGGICRHCTTHRRTTALHKRGSMEWPPSQLDSRYQFPDTTYQHQHESRPFGRYQSVASYSHSHSPYSPHSLTSPAASPSLIFSVMPGHAPASVFQDPDSHKS